MTHARSESELSKLRKLAEEFATSRKERTTSVHLLAAIAAAPGPASDLLSERRLDREGILKAGRSFDEDNADSVRRALVSAQEVAKRALLSRRAEPKATFPEPSSLHLLLALLADRRAAAHRALLHSGVDVARLRTAALSIALGVVAARRTPGIAAAPLAEEMPRAPRTTPGVTVPLFPPAPPAPPKKRHVTKVKPAPRPASVDHELAPTLLAFGRDLTKAAVEGQLDGVIGRSAEIERALDVLAKKSANAPCLVGPPGVGKTSVAYGVAQRMAADRRDGRMLVELSVAELVAGTGARGALAERLGAIKNEVRAAGGKIVVFIDELHELIASDGGEAAAELKVALGRGELPLIAATTLEQFRASVEVDPALGRRFTPVEIEEPDETEAFLVSRAVCDGYAKHHGLPYDDAAIASTVSWAVRYLPGRALPDKALSVLDLAGARAGRQRAESGQPNVVGIPEVAAVLADLVDVPLERLLETDGDRMLRLEELLAERVVGHGQALSSIAKHLRRNAAGLRGRRPIGSFLLLGPTGVGKTETAKAVAEALFHSADAMTRLDLSEFSEAHAVARLVGAPPGYVGHDAGGQLTEAVRRRPYQVVLLDEIEKAHRDVLEAFLQVLDEGRMTDGRGRRVDFTNTVIVLTSNLGAQEGRAAASERSVGFRASRVEASTSSRVQDAMMDAARRALPPELFNRFDEVLCFAPLSRENVAEIAQMLLAGLADALSARGVTLDVEPDAIDALLDAGGFDPELGARPMKRTIGRLIEAPLAELMLRGKLPSGSTALVGIEDGRIAVDAITAPASQRRAAS